MAIPPNISDGELIVRYVFSPRNVNQRKKLRPNTFTPPLNSDEVSVIRFEYSDATRCKQRAKDMSKEGRQYVGLAAFTAGDVRSCELEIVASPIINHREIPDTPEHADIKVGEVRIGEQMPAEIAKRISDLTDLAEYFEDLRVEEEEWQGREIELSRVDGSEE